MKIMSIGFLTPIVALEILILGGASPANAISADLAKMCRELAVKAHPPQRAGTTAYAQAERDFFRECVAKNGKMEDNSSAKTPPPAPD